MKRCVIHQITKKFHSRQQYKLLNKLRNEIGSVSPSVLYTATTEKLFRREPSMSRFRVIKTLYTPPCPFTLLLWSEARYENRIERAIKV